MSFIACSAKHAFRSWRQNYLRLSLCANLPPFRTHKVPQRCYNDGGQTRATEEAVAEDERPAFLREYKELFSVQKPNFQFNQSISINKIGTEVTAVGSLGKARTLGRYYTFVPLYGGENHRQVQLFARELVNEEARKALKTIPPNSAVSATGVLALKYEDNDPKNPKAALGTPKPGTVFLSQLEIRLKSITCLNTFPKTLMTNLNNYKNRHLQIRFESGLRERLQFRSKVAAFARQELADFTEIETPILFKSTPEGAREFIVPTRHRGHAYSLPQSPQQYKQLLMASGIYRYVQFAKCFRDEDHRADRQPEFTQIDLEMAWADGEDVMQRVERFMVSLWSEFITPDYDLPPFRRMKYETAMSDYGSDKPDLRIPGLIHRIEHIIPGSLGGMLTSLENPIVEAWKTKLDGDFDTIKQFVADYMDSPDAAEFRDNSDGAPGFFLFDPRRPLEGLQAFGFEGAEQLKSLYAHAAGLHETTDTKFDEGDVIIIQARANAPHTGGSTMLGKIRLAFSKAAAAAKLLEIDKMDRFLWVTHFPMFTPNSSGDGPGQEGESGFSATHHPFTAPMSAADVDLLLTDPLKAVADHYDLVLNGIELGGGSRRIHNAEMQEFIMKSILKMDPERLKSFSHLFSALRAGCPPHAGLAIGFDRLIAVMTGQESVREVIAFPKDKVGRDLMVGSPSKFTTRQLNDYHIRVRKMYETEVVPYEEVLFERLLQVLKSSASDTYQDRSSQTGRITLLLAQLDNMVRRLRPKTDADKVWDGEEPSKIARKEQVLDEIDTLLVRVKEMKEKTLASVKELEGVDGVIQRAKFSDTLEERLRSIRRWSHPELLAKTEEVIGEVGRLLPVLDVEVKDEEGEKKVLLGNDIRYEA